MAEKSNIEWTRSTFNPWWGCTKVGPGCDHCYAERDAHRFGTEWGAGQPRRFFGDDHWAKPRAWNVKAMKEQEENPNAQWRVFCASMADVFDNEVGDAHRSMLWKLVRETPFLTWLILTKRVGNVAKMLPADWGDGYPNVWLGITVVNQEEAERDIPKLLRIRARVRWLSMEPLLGPVRLHQVARSDTEDDRVYYDNVLTGFRAHKCGGSNGPNKIDWVVVGGESGPRARPMHPDWARSLRDQCAAAGVPFLFKQWGEWVPRGPESLGYPSVDGVPRFRMTDAGHNGQVLGAEGDNDVWMNRAGKKAAGRLLDGVQHDEYPGERA